jgi:hypothetical protein
MEAKKLEFEKKRKEREEREEKTAEFNTWKWKKVALDYKMNLLKRYKELKRKLRSLTTFLHLLSTFFHKPTHFQLVR